MSSRRAAVAAAMGTVIVVVMGIGLWPSAAARAAWSAAGPPVQVPLRVVVSIPPLKGLVKDMLAPESSIEVLVPPGVSEHGYEIPPSKIAALAKADLIVYVGLGLEPQVEAYLRDHPSTSRRAVCFADVAGLKADPHAEAHEHEHGHGEHADDDDHHHAVDPHLWLDPVQAKALVTAVRDAIRALRPAQSQPPGTVGNPDVVLSLRHGVLCERIDAVDAAYHAALDTLPHRTIVAAHDAYGWLAKRYNLEVVAIAGLNAAEPTPSAIAAAARAVKEKGVRVIFAEPQLSRAAAARLAQATGARIAVLDPLGDGDWFKLMDANLAALKDALADESSPKP